MASKAPALPRCPPGRTPIAYQLTMWGGEIRDEKTEHPFLSFSPRELGGKILSAAAVINGIRIISIRRELRAILVV